MRRLGFAILTVLSLAHPAMVAAACGERQCDQADALNSFSNDASEIVVMAAPLPPICKEDKEIPPDVLKAMVYAYRVERGLNNVRSVMFGFSDLQDLVGGLQNNQHYQKECNFEAGDTGNIVSKASRDLAKHCGDTRKMQALVARLKEELGNINGQDQIIDDIMNLQVSNRDRGCLRPEDVGHARAFYFSPEEKTLQKNSVLGGRATASDEQQEAAYESYRSLSGELAKLTAEKRCSEKDKIELIQRLRDISSKATTPVDLLRSFPEGVVYLRVLAEKGGDSNCEEFYKTLKRYQTLADEYSANVSNVSAATQAGTSFGKELKLNIDAIPTKQLVSSLGDVCERSGKDLHRVVCEGNTDKELLANPEEVKEAVARFRSLCPGQKNQHLSGLAKKACTPYQEWKKRCNTACNPEADCARGTEPADYCVVYPGDDLCLIRNASSTKPRADRVVGTTMYDRVLSGFARANMSLGNASVKAGSRVVATNGQTDSGSASRSSDSNMSVAPNTASTMAAVVAPVVAPVASAVAAATIAPTKVEDAVVAPAVTAADATDEESSARVSELEKQIRRLEEQLQKSEVDMAERSAEIERSPASVEEDEVAEDVDAEREDKPVREKAPERASRGDGPAPVVAAASVAKEVTVNAAAAPSAAVSASVSSEVRAFAADAAAYQSVARNSALAGINRPAPILTLKMDGVAVVNSSGQVEGLLEVPAPPADIVSPEAVAEYIRNQVAEKVGDTPVIVKLPNGSWWKVARRNNQLMVTAVSGQQLAELSKGLQRNRNVLNQERKALLDVLRRRLSEANSNN